ncbi:alkylmercury lyase [Dactylosporangium sp. NPDC048998]|uniref:alkylmercury lyase n=1 Tax=Dactylosporangium sp. NPDC048998 TaxID=3363976 RepID=UPI00371FCA96
MRIQLLLGEGCPNADHARTVVTQAARLLGLDAAVEEDMGVWPSPTVLVDGIDVMTGATGAAPIHACRTDLPTVERVVAALHHHSGIT